MPASFFANRRLARFPLLAASASRSSACSTVRCSFAMIASPGIGLHDRGESLPGAVQKFRNVPVAGDRKAARFPRPADQLFFVTEVFFGIEQPDLGKRQAL